MLRWVLLCREWYVPPGMMPETKSGRTLAESLTNDDRGITSSGMVGVVLAVAFGALIVAYIVPDALSEMSSASTNGWGSGASSLFEILPLLVVLAIALFFIGLALYAMRGL